MAISRIASQDATGTGTTSATATYAATPTVGNLLVAIVYEGNGLAQSPTGWTPGIGTSFTQFGAQGADVFYKIAGASESTTVTTAVDAGSSSTGIQIYEYSGFNGGTPTQDTSNSTNSATATGITVSSGSVTTAVANELIIVFGGFASAETFSSWTNSFVNRNAIPSATPHVFIADQVVSSVGTYSSTLTVTGTAATNGGGIITFQNVLPHVKFNNSGLRPHPFSPGLAR